MGDVIRQLEAAARRHPIAKPPEPLSQQQLDYIGFLLTPGHGSHRQYGIEHDIPDTTLSGWRHNARFKEEWARLAQQINGGLERTQVIMDKLFERAQRDNKAAELYLRLVERYTPTTRVITDDRRVEDMSDDELAAEWAATQERGA